MKPKGNHLKEIVEIVGVVSIVASVLLVAWELRQANQVAKAEIILLLQQSRNEINNQRAVSPDFAKLFPKLAAPESHLITATEISQIDGLARHFVNTCRAAQVAYDNGILSAEQLAGYRDDLATLIETYPGMRQPLLDVYDTFPAIREMAVFQPVAALALARDTETESTR